MLQTTVALKLLCLLLSQASWSCAVLLEPPYHKPPYHKPCKANTTLLMPLLLLLLLP